jgi:hypothetical protein
MGLFMHIAVISSVQPAIIPDEPIVYEGDFADADFSVNDLD